MKYEPAGVGNQPDPDEAGDEERRIGREADVARAREREAGARADTVHRGDDRLLERPDRQDVDVVRRAQHRRDVAALAERRQILPGREPAAGARDDDSAHRRIARLLERSLQSLVHLARERVQLVRPVERDRLDGPVAHGLDLRHYESSRNSTAGCGKPRLYASLPVAMNSSLRIAVWNACSSANSHSA